MRERRQQPIRIAIGRVPPGGGSQRDTPPFSVIAEAADRAPGRCQFGKPRNTFCCLRMTYLLRGNLESLGFLNAIGTALKT